MSLLYLQMASLIQEVAPLLIGKSLINCVESPSHYLNFTFQEATNNINFLICLKMPFLRFHLTKYLPENKQTNFSNLLIKHLKNSHLTHMQLLNNDRILELTFSTKDISTYIVVEFFPKKPNFYLLNSERQIILSYNQTTATQYHLPPIQCTNHLALAQPISSTLIEQFYQEKEKSAALNHAKIELSRHFLNHLKIAKRQRAKALQNLEACTKWDEVQHQAILLQSALYRIKKGMKEIAIADWTLDNQEIQIDLDPLVDPKTAINKLFTKSKKLREGSAHWIPIAQQAEADILNYQAQLNEVESATSFNDLKKFQNTLVTKTGRTQSKKKESVPYRLFHSSTGTEIWVGKSAKDNDEMTFRFAKGSDWWLHVHNYPGSHVIIRVAKGKEPDQQSLEEAIQLALKYSKAKDKGRVEVCVTQCKYVARMNKSAPGKVSISKHRIIKANSLPEGQSVNLRTEKDYVKAIIQTKFRFK